MKRNEGRAPSQRQLRVGEEIRHLLADALGRGEIRDPAVQDRTVTVTEVRASPDLKNATAYIMPLAGRHAEEVLPALKRAAPFLRSLVARSMSLRHVPALSFELDRSFDRAQHIDRLMRSEAVRRDLEPKASEAEEAAD